MAENHLYYEGLKRELSVTKNAERLQKTRMKFLNLGAFTVL